MSRRGTAIVVALGGLALMAAVLLTRRPEPATPKKPAPRVSPPPASTVDGPSRAATAAQIRSAEEELLVLCAKRDRLLQTKKELEQAAQKEQASADRRAAADELYRLAEKYFQAGDYDNAALQCQRAVETHPEHLPARALLQETKFLLRKSAGR